MESKSKYNLLNVYIRRYVLGSSESFCIDNVINIFLCILDTISYYPNPRVSEFSSQSIHVPFHRIPLLLLLSCDFI